VRAEAAAKAMAEKAEKLIAEATVKSVLLV